MPGTILCEQDGGLAIVTLSNPDKLNAIDAQMWRDLKATFSRPARRQAERM